MSVIRRLILLSCVTSAVIAAQSAPKDDSFFESLGGQVVKPQAVRTKKDIPTIARLADGSIVSIVMSDKDGKPIAQGSGFFVSADGLIVTNYHVISEGSSAVAKLPDGAFYAVDGVLTFDKARDVAVIKAHGKNFRPLTLGDSNRVQVGEEVVAIGNPLSLESTVSNGIVSGVRTVQDEGGRFLQITAPISPGSSGGPLFNMAGDVVGITTMYLKGGENLNFAIPINDAKLLLLDSSAKLSPLPNEPEHEEAKKPDADELPLTAEITSPAYHYFLELLKSSDMTFKVGTFACFEDDPQSTTFKVIFATLTDKDDLTVITSRFVNGVAKEPDGIFSGSVKPFAGGLFGTLPTLTNIKNMPSHETDAFEWQPDVLRVKTGFGKLLPGQLRISYEFEMQRSTGRYTEQGGVGDSTVSISNGKCIRIPNTQTPEETFRYFSQEQQPSPGDKAAPASGAEVKGLYLTSRPAGADVFIDGRKQPGQTPVTLPLAPGQYNLVLRMPGYQPYAGSVVVTASIQAQLDVQLKEKLNALGWAQVDSTPRGAEIFVDSTSTGQTTPARVQVPAGIHIVIVRLKGYLPMRRTVQVSEGGTATVELSLRPE